jgi:hypothetical protein
MGWKLALEATRSSAQNSFLCFSPSDKEGEAYRFLIRKKAE